MAWIESHEDVWEHHKTVRLCRILGITDIEAVGHLHSLWHFVLRNAWKDADLTPWGDDGIEAATRWRRDPGAMAAALREVGYLDGSVVHGWSDRAGKLVKDRLYNENRKSAAAKTNINAVNPRKSLATIPNHTQPTEYVNSAKAEPPIHPILKAWNETAHKSLPRATALTKKRKAAATARWKEHPDAAYWVGLIEKVNASPFCLGAKDWKANIDWLLRPDTGTLIIEGQYGSAPVKTAPAVKCLGCSSRKPEPGAKFCRECSWCYKCDNDGRESKKDPTNLTRTDKGQLCGDCLRGIKC